MILVAAGRALQLERRFSVIFKSAMKKCPQCRRTYADESFSFCLEDGALLSASYDRDATLVIPAPINSEPTTTARVGTNRWTRAAVAPFTNMLGAAKGALIRAAASTQPFGVKAGHAQNKEGTSNSGGAL